MQQELINHMNMFYIKMIATGTNKINKDSTGGNYFFDYKSGIVFFPDHNLVSSHTNSTTPPLFTFVKYIGPRGIENIETKIEGIDELSNFTRYYATGEKGDKGEVLWYEKGDKGIQFSRHIIPAIDNSYDIGSRVIVFTHYLQKKSMQVPVLFM